MHRDPERTVRADAPSEVQVLTEPLGGSALSLHIQRGDVPSAWKLTPPGSAADWTDRVRATQRAFAGREWRRQLDGAIRAAGPAAERLDRVVRAEGIVVTTGQQPGLFGGPGYTWSKALSALALADAIEAATGVPAMPLFWAATDDADLAEAQTVWLAGDAGAIALAGAATAPAGTPAAVVAQGDLTDALRALRTASGSLLDADLFRTVEQAYGDPAKPIGAAYIELLQALLAPLGIAVVDASHPAIRRAGAPLAHAVLRDAPAIADALARRSAEIRAAGFEPQVEEVPGLTPVFTYDGDGAAKRRVTIVEAPHLADAHDESLGANVLLRPVVEAAILPTVAYVAGPGELAYFAQATALAEALGTRVPVAVPRWSATLVEPRMQRALDRLGIAPDALADPHAVATALARAAMPAPLAAGLADARAAMGGAADRVAAADDTALLSAGVVEGFRTRVLHQLDRLERRAVAAVKRREARLMQDVAMVRGYFFPGGKRQERASTLLPTLIRHGRGTLLAMLTEARRHASRLVDPSSTPDAGPAS